MVGGLEREEHGGPSPTMESHSYICIRCLRLVGMWAVWQQAWLQHPWGREWASASIAAKELVLIMAACAIWGLRPYQQVLVQCDNMAVVQVISAQSSRDRTIMQLLRCIHFFCAANDFKLRAKHIPGRHNVLADAIFAAT